MPTFVVEDGTAKIDSTSYVTVAEATDYLSIHPLVATWTGLADDTVRENHLMAATRFLEREYAGQWQGSIVDSDQALDWPRFEVYDENGTYISSTTIPTNLKHACIELAVRNVSGDLSPDIAKSADIKSTSVGVGPVRKSVEYVGGLSPRTQYLRVDQLIEVLLDSNFGGNADRAVRA